MNIWGVHCMYGALSNQTKSHNLLLKKQTPSYKYINKIRVHTVHINGKNYMHWISKLNYSVLLMYLRYSHIYRFIFFMIPSIHSAI